MLVYLYITEQFLLLLLEPELVLFLLEEHGLDLLDQLLLLPLPGSPLQDIFFLQFSVCLRALRAGALE